MSNGAKESLLLRVNDKMTRDTCATCVMRISTHRGTARYFYFSPSLSFSVCLCARFLFVRRCGGEKEAFIVLSVRYWNTRGMIVRGESGTSGWKMESRLARRLFLPCRLITSCKHPRLAVNLLKMHAMRFFYPFFFFSLFSLLLFFPFLWFGCESKRASIFSDDCEESLKKLFFAGIPCSRFESREAWTSPSPRDENLIKESLLIALRLSNRISTRVRN